MRISVVLCAVCAIALHAGFLLFGGALFPRHDDNRGVTQEVDLLGETDKPEDQKEDEPEELPEEEIETESEEVPDAEEIVRNLESPVVNDAPALEAASLSAIEAALSGQAASGDFASAMSFTSGGRIGGTGQAGGLDEQLEQAFSLAEIDQKPRPVYQVSPTVPSSMRGKKSEGLVTIIFIVDSSGKVNNARVEKSSHQAYEKPALDAVRKWKFEPGVRAGQRVATKMRVPIRFPVS